MITRHSLPSLLQRTADKATAKNLKFSFQEKIMVQQGLIEKFILAFSNTLHNGNDFQVTNSLSIFQSNTSFGIIQKAHEQ